MTIHPLVLALPAPTQYAPLTVEALHALVLATLNDDEATALRILAFPCDTSAFVPPPADLDLEPDRSLPLGHYHILVVQGQAQVVRTLRPGASEQLVSVPVANADALRPLAEYVVRSARGMLEDPPYWYSVPDWLLRLVEGAAS